MKSHQVLANPTSARKTKDMQLGAVQGRDIGNGRDERVEGVDQTEWHDESLSTFDFEVEVNESDVKIRPMQFFLKFVKNGGSAKDGCGGNHSTSQTERFKTTYDNGAPF